MQNCRLAERSPPEDIKGTGISAELIYVRREIDKIHRSLEDAGLSYVDLGGVVPTRDCLWQRKELTL